MGEEFGEYTSQTPNQPNKLNWILLSYELNCNLFDYYKNLISRRKCHPALHTENIDFFHEDPEAKIIAYLRWHDPGSQIVVVANFSGKLLRDYSVLNFPKSGIWQDRTGDTDKDASLFFARKGENSKPSLSNPPFYPPFKGGLGGMGARGDGGKGGWGQGGMERGFPDPDQK
ncbi:alpha amylase C-terminal domain-containing protein [Coleofasciculus sp.]|uniref:alpha amylase C-terminal domain-containing protein n=1 Tax=Coleofasciculus sp. TaxID=3100458 RepID=UPI0039F95169